MSMWERNTTKNIFSLFVLKHYFMEQHYPLDLITVIMMGCYDGG